MPKNGPEFPDSENLAVSINKNTFQSNGAVLHLMC